MKEIFKEFILLSVFMTIMVALNIFPAKMIHKLLEINLCVGLAVAILYVSFFSVIVAKSIIFIIESKYSEGTEKARGWNNKVGDEK